jgi:large subunit ribosomal protein L15
MVSLSDINHGIQKNRRKRRVGRGTGSGRGKTSSRGHKGAGSRAGFRSRRGYEGGQMPLFRRIAKRGFSNAAFADTIKVVNLDQLNERFEDGQEVSLDDLRSAFSFSRKVKVKVLGRGDLNRKLTVYAHGFSASAEEAIAKAGGSVVRT